jgi:DNA mismatch endonuclease (patch repair protein)
MVDVFSAEMRSWVMSRVGHWDTKPEKVVRSLLHRMGYRFRLRRANLPGKPDIVLPRHRKVVFVHGCFWHGHVGCRRAARPTSNVDFWNARLDGNMERDRTNQRRLRRMGWGVLVIWECQTTCLTKVEARLRRFLA